MTAARLSTVQVPQPHALREAEQAATHTSSRPASDPAASSVQFQNVCKTYAGATGTVRALHGIDLEIRRGEVFGFIGRSGAGKSTLIRLINRLEEPSTGQVKVNGVATAGFDEDALVALRRRIGMIFQHFNLMSAKTVAQNVGLPLVMAGHPKAAIESRVKKLLDLVGLADKHGAYPAQLSGGQKQRVGIARALVHEPDILLCDEATSALDPETTQSILALLRDINRRLGITVILITHEMAVIREVCDRVAVLEQGAVVEHGEVWQVFGAPRHEVTRSLLGQVNHGLPDDLAGKLRPHVQGGEPVSGTLLLRIGFSGDAGTPDLGALARALGGSGSVHLLDSSINRIQERTFGHLLVGVPARLIDNTRLKEALPGAEVEILGHVPDRL